MSGHLPSKPVSDAISFQPPKSSLLSSSCEGVKRNEFPSRHEALCIRNSCRDAGLSVAPGQYFVTSRLIATGGDNHVYCLSEARKVDIRSNRNPGMHASQHWLCGLVIVSVTGIV